ncbi:MAG: hypothetical protein NT154_10725 [Verrucomicrobia bacterium]|nr:hypothetical protein [Verrucomicrobiota bacterium]
MEMIIAIVVLEFVAIAVTSIWCWWASRRHRRAGWHIGILGAVGVGLAVLLSDGSMLFHPSEWRANKRSLDAYIWEFVVTTSIAIIPTLFVVRYFRKKFEEDGTKMV